MQAGPPRAAREVFGNADRGVLLYGLTPPRQTTSADRMQEIAAATLARLAPLDLDALVLYDVDAEQDRAAGERPFPFVPMLDPSVFLSRHLGAWTGPVIVYRAVGKYPRAEIGTWLQDADPGRLLTVLVGASSRDQQVQTSLAEAQRARAELNPALTLGGVVLAERHATRRDEHLRMLRKQDAGATFFVSQICYDLDHTRDLLSDYVYECRRRGTDPRPVVVTLAPCGSATTLDFLTWLGVDVPGWVRNDIVLSGDPLALSFEQCVAAAGVLRSFCRRLQLPFGINVESVTNRKAEIEASVQLAAEVRGLLGPS